MMENRNYMKCSEFQDIVHELDRSGTKGNELREEALIHAESCGHCGVLLTETESLDFGLARIANEPNRSAASSRVEAALLQEFRRAKKTSEQRRMQWRIAAIGVAAALFLVLGISLQRFYAPSHELGFASQPSVAKSAEEADRSSTESPRNVVQDNVKGSAAATHVSPAPQASESDETEVAQNFTPLPYADDPSMMEGGSVVRVILSRSALASLGMPVSGIENRDQIPADLVVSADGTPEAIRLIAQNAD
jgi:hypothetical protein